MIPNNHKKDYQDFNTAEKIAFNLKPNQIRKVMYGKFMACNFNGHKVIWREENHVKENGTLLYDGEVWKFRTVNPNFETLS